MRRGSILLAVILAAVSAFARHTAPSCGTTRETPAERQFFHRQAIKHPLRPRAAMAAPSGRDVGDIAVMDDGNGVVYRVVYKAEKGE